MNSIDRLTELFRSFPGIGPRQARRFVYYLLSRNGSYSEEFVRAVQELKKEITQCVECQRFYARSGGSENFCTICADDTRDSSMLMLVPRDIDMEAVERSGSYKGYYFVLGGVVPILEKEPEKRVRINDLQKTINKRKDLKEIILAMNANQEGENTAEYIREKFKSDTLTFSTLGRGLSTGAELEYADPETLRNALIHRTK